MRETTAYDVFDAVRRRAWEYLSEPTVEHLATFWNAVQWTMRRCDAPFSMGLPDFTHFGSWIAARHGDGLHTGGWQHFIGSARSGKEGFDEFFRELDAFRSRRIQRVARARLAEPRVWPTYTTRAGLNIDGVVVSILPEVVQVELRAYLPDEAYFIVAVRVDGSETERWCWTKRRAEDLARIELGVDPEAWEALAAEE